MDEKTQLITDLDKVFNRWEKLLGSLPQEKITEPDRIAEMSIKDILAHLTVWQQISVARLYAALDNEVPVYPAWHPDARHPEFDPDSDEGTDRMNAWIHAAYRERSWSDIHTEWKERFARVLELAKSIPEKDLLETGKYDWLPGYPLSAVLLGTLEHHQEHLDPLIALEQAGKL